MWMLTAVLLLATPDLAPDAAKPIDPIPPVVAQRSRDKVWLELDAGPLALHHSGIRGLESGPEVRLSVGLPIGDRFAAEIWALGALQSGRAVVGDEAAAGGGLGARLKLHDFTGDGRLQLFGRAGAGLVAPTTPDAPHGLSGFAGALLLLQPPVRRFALGLELDATVVGRAYGMALLPTLRCAL
jgi:hypothetical protein